MSPNHGRKFPPLAADHPTVGTDCPACHQKFSAGDVVTLIALGPGADEDERRKAQEGRPYTAVAVVVHWLCSGGTP